MRNHHAAELAALAALLADETRAAFCLALLDGRAWTAGELARHASVAPSTTTEHLNRLIEGGLLVGERQGRHRYVRLASDQVATLVEDLSSHQAPSEQASTLRQSTKQAALARARTCYDHLAGQLGVAVTDAMTRAGYLDQEHGFALTDAGLRWLTGPLGVDPATLQPARRPLARPCLDWTERRPHLGGLAGARLCERALQQRWVERIGTGRAVRLTRAGERTLLTA